MAKKFRAFGAYNISVLKKLPHLQRKSHLQLITFYTLKVALQDYATLY